MKLILGKSMPPFVRTVWVSPEAQRHHGEKVSRALSAYHELEYLTVKHGVRPCMTRHFRPDELPVKMREVVQDGLVFMPLQQVGSYRGFAHYHPPVEPGKPYTFYGVIGKPEDALLFQEATRTGDHVTMGRLLGYAPCCTEFFDKVWRQEGYIDPVFQAAENALSHPGNVREGNTIVLGEYSQLVLSVLRYLGVRITANIPCSPTCKQSHNNALAWLELGQQLKVDGVEELLDLLRMPMEWSVKNGIARILTPVFTLVTNSMWPTETHTVRFLGHVSAEDVPFAAQGTVFPYVQKSLKGLKRSLARFEEALLES